MIWKIRESGILALGTVLELEAKTLLVNFLNDES